MHAWENAKFKECMQEVCEHENKWRPSLAQNVTKTSMNPRHGHARVTHLLFMAFIMALINARR